MKSNMLCAFLTAMLLFSTVTFGEIIENPWSTGTSCSADSSASKSDPSPPADYDDAWTEVYTTVGGLCTWSGECQAFAAGETVEYEGWAQAQASADADVYPDHGNTVSNDAYIDLSGDDWDLKWPPTQSDEGQEEYDPYEGVYAECEAVAAASVEEGSGSTAVCASWAVAYPGLREDE